MTWIRVSYIADPASASESKRNRIQDQGSKKIAKKGNCVILWYWYLLIADLAGLLHLLVHGLDVLVEVGDGERLAAVRALGALIVVNLWIGSDLYHKLSCDVTWDMSKKIHPVPHTLGPISCDQRTGSAYRLSCNADPEPGSVSAWMLILIQMRIRSKKLAGRKKKFKIYVEN